MKILKKILTAKIKPVGALSQARWRCISSSLRKSLICLFLTLTAASCKTIYIPTETNTETHYVDSTIYNYIDSVRITEKTRYRDFAWMGDTLNLVGSRSRAWAVADTLKGAIVGEIEEDPVEEKTKIIFKDRIQYRDSLVYKEVPVEVEKIEYKTPKWAYWSLVLNIAFLLLTGLGIYIKLKGKRLL